MITTKKSTVFFLTAVMILFTGYSNVFAGAGGVGAPWFPNEGANGRYEYEGTVYLDFVDSGKGSVPGGIGTRFGDPFREEVMYVNFLLVLYPLKPNAEPIFFSGIGKTCEWFDEMDPVCPAGAEKYNELFYIPGDYLTRLGPALHTFLRETVYPALCGSSECGDLKEAALVAGSGNVDDAVNPSLSPDPIDPPWYWAQPITLVIRP